MREDLSALHSFNGFKPQHLTPAGEGVCDVEDEAEPILSKRCVLSFQNIYLHIVATKLTRECIEIGAYGMGREEAC